MAPSNYTLRFDVGVTLQKFSASTLQKEKRTVDEVNLLSLLFHFPLMLLVLSVSRCLNLKIISYP